MAILIRAPWVVPVTAPPVADGGVLLDRRGTVLAVGPFSRVAGGPAARRYAGGELQVRVVDGILMPALVNAHVHLELAWLAGRVAPGGPMPAWIERLLAVRERQPIPDTLMLQAGARLLADLHRQGVGAVLDIGNQPAAANIGHPAARPCRLFLREFLGSEPPPSGSTGEPVTAHAPYSCWPRLLLWAKEESRRLGTPFSIHLAESGEELSFLRHGSGPFADFFRRRGLVPPPCPGQGPVAYLDRLGLLDGQTACVHAVHLSSADMALLARRGARIVLCPGSNRFIGVGRPDVAAMLAAGLRPALGTDSPASNETISLWREMRLLAEEHPAIAPADILRMATLAGADLLGLDGWGRIEPGATGPLIVVRPVSRAGKRHPFPVPGPADTTGPEDVERFLLHCGEECQVEWLP